MDEIRLSKLDQEVLDCLSLTEWKSVHEMSEEMSKRRKFSWRRKIAYVITAIFMGTDLAEVFVYESHGGIYTSLDKFESAGWVEWRWRAGSEKILYGRRLRCMEWRLTEQGHHVRAALPTETGHVRGQWTPQKA